MTKYLLVVLGLLLIFVGLTAPYESQTMWSEFLAVSSLASMLRELLGLFMIVYAVVPNVRTIMVRRVFGAFSAFLAITTAVGIWHSSMLIIDMFIFSAAAVSCLLGSLELSAKTDQKPFASPIKTNIELPKTKIRRAH